MAQTGYCHRLTFFSDPIISDEHVAGAQNDIGSKIDIDLLSKCRVHVDAGRHPKTLGIQRLGDLPNGIGQRDGQLVECVARR